MGLKKTPHQEPDAASDAAVSERTSAGETASFGVSFDRHCGAVYTHCLRRTGSAADAEDLTSMTFLEIVRRTRSPRFVDGSLLPWLLVVATNLARNQAPGQRRYAAALSKLALDRHMDDFADDADDRVDGQLTLQASGRAVEQLTRRQQEVLTLCDLSGLSYAQAALVLGVPVGTVQSRLARARRHLQPLLSDHSPPTRAAVVNPTSGASR